MSAAPSPLHETIKLADAMFDRQLTPQSVERLESLIIGDLHCLQAYVERMAFHSELMEIAFEQMPQHMAVSVFDNAVRTIAVRERRQSRRHFTTVAIITCFLVFMAWWVVLPIFNPTAVGLIATLSADATGTHTPLELGKVVHQGQILRIEQGIVTLQLPHVMVDVLAPSSIRMTGPEKIEILSGVLHAHVQQGGEGFAVHTPDSMIVDYGTEFSVEYIPGSETEVNVRQGRVQASLLDWKGIPSKRMDLANQRAVRLNQKSGTIKEVDYQVKFFEKIDRSRGVISSISGTLRTFNDSLLSLQANNLTTPNHMLIIPEQRIKMESAYTVQGIEGPVTLSEGTVVTSYLIHYDPDHRTKMAPRGSITFDGRISAVLSSSEALSDTDDLFGLTGVTYEQRKFRGLELDEDELHISEDRQTVSVYFGVSGQPLDQTRILVISQ